MASQSRGAPSRHTRKHKYNRITVDAPPKQLDGADVLQWAISPTGCFYNIMEGEKAHPVAAMAIARYAKSLDIYLFSCDSHWEVIGDTDCDSVDEATRVAQRRARNQPLNWHSLHPPDPAK